MYPRPTSIRKDVLSVSDQRRAARGVFDRITGPFIGAAKRPAAAVAGAAAVLAFLLLSVAGRSTEVAAEIRVLPGNPVAGRAVVLTMSGSELVGTGYRWEFGDGEVSQVPAPMHVYREAGEYPLRLTVETASGPVVVSKMVSVSAATTLQLLGGRFDVTLFARDQRTGNTGDGLALPENDLFGYFAIPALTNNPDNPEMFVKILDGRVINGQFWVFYNGLTDLDVTLTVRENPTGIVKTYRKEPGSACGGFDTSGFTGGGPTPPPVTATPTPPGPTPTPTTPPSSTIIVELEATRFEWNAEVGGTPSGAFFNLRVGNTYQFRIRSGDPPGTNAHAFSGIPTLGLSGGTLTPGNNPLTTTITVTNGMMGQHPYACTLTSCGDGHFDMIGRITVVP